jgi:hypothetical protein
MRSITTSPAHHPPDPKMAAIIARGSFALFSAA